MQLIEDGRVDMLDTMNDRRIGREQVIEKFGVGPEQVGEVLALMGDSVDNVPGVPGVGPKTASQLIQQYGDVENVLAHVEEITKPKLKANLIEHAGDGAAVARAGPAGLRRAACPSRSTTLAMKGIPEEPLREFLEHHGFKSLLARLSGGQAQAGAPAPSAGAQTGRGGAGAGDRPLALRDRHRRSGAGPLDRRHRRRPARSRSTPRRTGATASPPNWSGSASPPGPTAPATSRSSMAAATCSTSGRRSCRSALVLERLKPLLEDPAILKIGHNLKFDWVVLNRRGISIAPYDDTLVMSFNLDAGGLNSHALDDLAKKHLDHDCIPYKSLCGTGQKQITFDKVPVDKATEYAAEDADVALRLWRRFRTRLPFENVTRVYELVDRPMVAVIGAMERDGVKVDRGRAARAFRASSTPRSPRWRRRSAARPAASSRIGSPAAARRRAVQQDGPVRRPQGQVRHLFDRRQNELERLAREGVPIARLVLDWRQLTKLKSTYTDALQEQINPSTGRVHTSYSLSGAQTGRLASTDPNLMNIPIRTEIGRRIRDAFIAEPGHVMMSADYSQIELRLAAHVCDVPQLKEAFAAGADIHNMTAIELFGEANRDTRGQAKTINFAILYGISRWGLARPPGRHRRRGAGDHRPLFRALPRHPRLYRRDAVLRPRDRVHHHPVRPQDPFPAHQVATSSTSGRAPSGRRSTRRSRARRPTSSSGRWRGWRRRLPPRA